MELAGCAERLISARPNKEAYTSQTTIGLDGLRKMRQPSCLTTFINTLSEQFKLHNIRFGHYPVDDFYKSQWQNGDRSIWWLLYRWCVAIFFIASVLATAVSQFDSGRFFIYLTDWGFILCMTATTYGAVLTTLWHLGRVDIIEQDWSVKIFWMLHWSALVLAIVITVMFWTLLYPEMPELGGDPYNLLQHAFNSVFMLLDHFVVAFPSRILHFVYPLGLGAVYCLFSLIYYFCGGTGALGSPFIYPILDWSSSPGIACLSVVIAVVCCFIFSFLLFWMFKLRVFLYKQFAYAQSPHVIPR